MNYNPEKGRYEGISPRTHKTVCVEKSYFEQCLQDAVYNHTVVHPNIVDGEKKAREMMGDVEEWEDIAGQQEGVWTE